MLDKQSGSHKKTDSRARRSGREQFKKMMQSQDFGEFLTTTLIGGLLVLLPLVIFIMLVAFVLRLVGKVIQPIALIFSSVSVAPFVSYILAFIIVVAACFIIGLAFRTRTGNSIIRYFNRKYLSKLPFYSTIQETVQQLFGKKESSFSQVVLVDVFDTLMTGFVTAEHLNDIYTIFVPTAPNPTNGYVFHVKKEKLIFLDIKTEDAMRTIIGVGTGSQILFNYQEKKQMEDTLTKQVEGTEKEITVSTKDPVSGDGVDVKVKYKD